MKKKFYCFLLIIIFVLNNSYQVFATTYDASMVVSYANSLVGSYYDADYCLRFVKECFLKTYGFKSSANCAYEYAMSYRDSTSMDNIPLGADVFFSYNGYICQNCGNGAGHIGIYVGDGYYVHAAGGTVKKTKVIDTHNSSSHNYLGWGWHGNKVLSNSSQATTPPKSIPQISSIKGNGSNVTVTWNAVSGAEKYTVDFWNPNGSHNYFSTTSTSMTQSLPDAQYGIRICAENSAGTSGFSNFHYFWVSKSNVPAVPPITDIDVKGTSVTVKWDATDKTNSYTVDFWNAETGVHNYYQVGDTTITQTLPSAQYGIRICSENSAGTSRFSSFYYVYVGEYPISFDANGGELEKTKARITYDSINGTRGEDQLVIYNNSGTSTGTNMYGIEVLINKSNQVIDIINRVGSATVPTNGFVLSAHREKHYWLEENVSIGDYVNYHPNTQEVWIWSKNGWLTGTKRAEIGKEYGELPIPLNREGYTFDGWYTSATGSEKVTEATTVVAAGEHTLYAHWIPIEAHTSTTINNNLFTIKCTNIENGNRVILALYKDKKFVKLYEDIYQGEDIPFTVTEDYDEAKVMVWKDLSTLKPITDVEIVK